jgi:hypothetical protein
VPLDCDFEADIRYGRAWFPRKTETTARALAGTEFSAGVALFATSSGPRLPLGDRFRSSDLMLTAVEPEYDDSFITRVRRRRYTFDRFSGLVIAEPLRTIAAGDVIHDSLRVATLDDLRGAELMIEVTSETKNAPVELYEVTMKLPDKRQFVIHREDFEYLGSEGASAYYKYQFPHAAEDLAFMLGVLPAFHIE